MSSTKNMNLKVYKWCAVPQCVNTSVKAPNKLFIYVPNKKAIRDQWLRLARRDPTAVTLNSPIYFCEDHFNLPKDMENFMQYHIMGSVSQVRMKPGCLPSKFHCLTDKTKPTSETKPPLLKKQKKKIKRDIGTQYMEPGETLSESSEQTWKSEENMNFLVPHLKKTKNNNYEETPGNAIEYEIEVNVTHKQESTDEEIDQGYESQTKLINNDETKPRTVNIIINQQEHFVNSETVQNDALYHFFINMYETTKRLPTVSQDNITTNVFLLVSQEQSKQYWASPSYRNPENSDVMGIKSENIGPSY